MRLKVLIITGIIIIVAVITNPNQDQHRLAVKNKLTEYFQKSSTSENFIESAGKVLGSILGGLIIDNIVSSNNYLLFSTTQLTLDDKKETIGIGIFGNVFIFKNLEDLKGHEGLNLSTDLNINK